MRRCGPEMNTTQSSDRYYLVTAYGNGTYLAYACAEDRDEFVNYCDTGSWVIAMMGTYADSAEDAVAKLKFLLNDRN